MKLQEHLDQYQERPVMQVSIRLHRNRRILVSQGSQTGAYWWLPDARGQWVLDVYYDREHHAAHPSELWLQFVLTRLAVMWKLDPASLRRSLPDHYAAFPRGRVRKTTAGFALVHGGDAPPGSDGVDAVLDAFNLRDILSSTPAAIQIVVDEQEAMKASDFEEARRVLGIDLGQSGSR